MRGALQSKLKGFFLPGVSSSELCKKYNIVIVKFKDDYSRNSKRREVYTIQYKLPNSDLRTYSRPLQIHDPGD